MRDTDEFDIVKQVIDNDIDEDINTEGLPPDLNDVFHELFETLDVENEEEAMAAITSLTGDYVKIHKARKLAGLKKYDRALEILGGISPLLLDSYIGQITLAMIHSDLGHYDEAVKHCDRAIERAPEDDFAFVVKTSVCLLAGRDDEAEEAAAAAVRLAPGEADNRLALGSVLMIREQWEDALSHCMASLSGEPDSVTAMYYCAYCLVFLGKVEQAEEMCRKTLAIDPFDVSVLDLLVMIYSKRGRLKESLSCARDVLRLQPNTRMAHKVRTIEFECHRWEKAGPDGSEENGTGSSGDEKKNRAGSSGGHQPSPAVYRNVETWMKRYFPGGEQCIFNRFSEDKIAGFCEGRTREECLGFLVHLNKVTDRKWHFFTSMGDPENPESFEQVMCGCGRCRKRFMKADEYCREAAQCYAEERYRECLDLLLHSIITENSYRPAYMLKKRALSRFNQKGLLGRMTDDRAVELDRLLDTLLLDVGRPESLLKCAVFMTRYGSLRLALPYFVGWADSFGDHPSSVDIVCHPGGSLIIGGNLIEVGIENGNHIESRIEGEAEGGITLDIDQVIEVISSDNAYLERLGTFILIARSSSRKLLPVLEKLLPLIPKYEYIPQVKAIRGKIHELQSM